MVKAIVGANWGDEGKGKITDVLANDSDVVIRFQGGANAGHTIINNYGKFALHQLPSGVFHQNITNVIGNGVAFSVENFVKEIKELEDRGVPKPNILISDRAQIVMPYHVAFDCYEEERLGKNSFGSTKSGIAPFYSDKYSKIGFQINELYDDVDSLKAKIAHAVEIKNATLRNLYNKEEITVDEVFDKLMGYKKVLAPYVGDSFRFVRNAIAEGKNILLEGQLGSLKDTDFGIYPMVTSSNTIAGYGAVGAGIPPYEIKEVITVVKAYSSAVGAGEFVSEIFGEEADKLRNFGGDGGEYGATTGRPRRMGWLDLVASRYGCQVQGATSVAFTVIDALGYLDEIPVCVAYELDGEVIDYFPSTTKLKRCKPVLKTLKGWKCDVTGIKKYEDLPKECREYIEFAEKEIGVHIGIVSNGPSRDDIIYR
ncbi:MAG: adenylosuccinate synthase [Ruminococcus sp.]|nr:adenylosuccinate synthase [Ruminococcus sp.]